MGGRIIRVVNYLSHQNYMVIILDIHKTIDWRLAR